MSYLPLNSKTNNLKTNPSLKPILICITVLALTASLAWADGAAVAKTATPSDSKAVAAFETMKTMEGTWHGTSARGAEVEVDYELTGGGTILMERYRMAGHGEMVTMYHLDGESILLTHYCSVGNQPRMRASKFTAEGEYRFDFVDVSGATESGHMHHALVRYDGGDDMSSDWTFHQGGEDQFTETVAVQRAD